MLTSATSAAASIDAFTRKARMQLYIGNKNYSSWSLRAWVALTQQGIAFEEVKLRLSFTPGSPFKTRLA
jgi:glutathione S-transferase